MVRADPGSGVIVGRAGENQTWKLRDRNGTVGLRKLLETSQCEEKFAQKLCMERGNKKNF